MHRGGHGRGSACRDDQAGRAGGHRLGGGGVVLAVVRRPVLFRGGLQPDPQDAAVAAARRGNGGGCRAGRDLARGRGADFGSAVRVDERAWRPRQPVPALGRQRGAAACRWRRDLPGHAAGHPRRASRRGDAKLYLRQ
ncbi:hypothetical protein G6F31_017927 [Rhizopus arrhizus]|nr:hypothetical protein G6F31_017927 [Rhizopus arrhizus]